MSLESDLNLISLLTALRTSQPATLGLSPLFNASLTNYAPLLLGTNTQVQLPQIQLPQVQLPQAQAALQTPSVLDVMQRLGVQTPSLSGAVRLPTPNLSNLPLPVLALDDTPDVDMQNTLLPVTRMQVTPPVFSETQPVAGGAAAGSTGATAGSGAANANTAKATSGAAGGAAEAGAAAAAALAAKRAAMNKIWQQINPSNNAFVTQEQVEKSFDHLDSVTWDGKLGQEDVMAYLKTYGGDPLGLMPLLAAGKGTITREAYLAAMKKRDIETGGKPDSQYSSGELFGLISFPPPPACPTPAAGGAAGAGGGAAGAGAGANTGAGSGADSAGANTGAGSTGASSTGANQGGAAGAGGASTTAKTSETEAPPTADERWKTVLEKGGNASKSAVDVAKVVQETQDLDELFKLFHLESMDADAFLTRAVTLAIIELAGGKKELTRADFDKIKPAAVEKKAEAAAAS